jgi:hypothetical protein
MAISEARLNANRQNAQRSTGPRTAEGKSISRANSLKHGLTGAGVVLPNEDAAEIERRLAAFQAELEPEGEVGAALVRRAAVLSVRLDRCVSQEAAALSTRIRQVEADFVPPEGADADLVEKLRAEARAEAMFDPSPEASLARKYEAAAERGFFRALRELRELRKHARVVEPEPSPEELQELLASFSQLHAASNAIKAEPQPADFRPPANPVRRPESAPIAAFAGPVDVPISIGRRC